MALPPAGVFGGGGIGDDPAEPMHSNSTDSKILGGDPARFPARSRSDAAHGAQRQRTIAALGLALSLGPALTSQSVSSAGDQGRPAHPAEAIQLDVEIPWMMDPAVFLDGRRPKRSLSKEEAAFDRGKLLDDAIAKAKASGRLVLWYIPRITEEQLRGRQMYRGPVLDIYMRQVLFSDPDVVGIVNASFVPLRMVYDESMAKRFGLRPLDFIEPAVLVLDGEGKAVLTLDQIRTFHASWFAHLLKRVRKTAQATVDTGDGSPGALALAGEWDAALKALEREEANAARQYRMAGLARRQRDFDQASAYIASARLALDSDPDGESASPGGSRRGRRRNPAKDTLRTAIGMEEALLWMNTRRTPAGLEAMHERLTEASLQLQNAWRRERWVGVAPRRAEAGYMLGLCHWLLGQQLEAAKWFQLTADNFPDSPWGRKANANTTLGPDQRPLGAVFCGFESFGQIPADFITAQATLAGRDIPLPVDTRTPPLGYAPGTESAEDPMLKRMQESVVISIGMANLLELQRSDGGFTDSRYAYWTDPRITPNAWTAISAIATMGLWEGGQQIRARGKDVPAEIRDRIDLGTRWLLQPGRVLRGVNEEIYADAFRIDYLARRVAAKDDPDGRLAKAAAKLVQAAAANQHATGFWAHEYPNAFCTGAMLWALLDAKDAGIEVPEEVLRKGAAALQSARTPDGAYSYSGSAERRKSSVKDASARMPICEGALLRLSLSSDQDFERACMAFSDNMERIENISRNDFHSDGELGGFFFFHGMFFASEVADMLPDPQAKALKAKMAAMIPTLMELDGSFLDSHEQGRTYGTAMALLTMLNCMDR